MIKVDIINEVSKAADITKVKAEVAVEAVLEAMKDSMMKGERIELRGFGVFQVKPRKRGIGRNPRTGKEVKIPPGRTIRFKPGKDLQNLSQADCRILPRIPALPEPRIRRNPSLTRSRRRPGLASSGTDGGCTRSCCS
jgi:Bacterial nucleoid DNA-binding protein